MSSQPLFRAEVDVLGRPFHAIWTPEDGALRAAGFATAADPAADSLVERLARLDPGLAARGFAPDASGSSPVVSSLRAYAAGDLRAIDGLIVAQPGSPFRAEVWQALRRVPAGGTVTYTALASLAGRPKAVRAAASACANNLIALVVPCHRIVRSDGGLGGYLFGTEVKERLLSHEGAGAQQALFG
ncbi:methylated-DNA--[protein]-cysteine S-methyltransferase [Leucobacter massiliensis]|uniref:methylated-DNA--[protein]-cysteine S-methyltransferase n=1 Tax=Leucobacter massiliensis TaxID=1686285 RepID=A0A2S9QNR2_9MICO|nr:methylated-DNA--[protein]-cysteine S-methyltransferase [Leucobacter massiliensis]PRI11235.1 cysteine methyltransferase [Leucobacter massiliensis]